MKKPLLKFRAWRTAYSLERIRPEDFKYIAKNVQNFRIVHILKGPPSRTAFRIYLKGWHIVKEGDKEYLQQKPQQFIRMNVEPVDVDPVAIIETAIAQMAHAFDVPLELVKPKKVKHRWKFIERTKQLDSLITCYEYTCVRCGCNRRTFSGDDGRHTTVYYFPNGDVAYIAGECPDTINPNKTKKTR